MKFNIKILVFSLVIIFCLIGAYYCGLYTRYNFVTAYVDIIAKNYQISRYGELGWYEEQESVVAPDLGFKVVRSYGCNVNSGIINGVDSYNKIMDRYIEDNVCRNWRIKLENGSRLLHHQDSLALSILDKCDFKKTRSDIPLHTNIQFSIDKRGTPFYQFSGYGYVDSLQKTYKFFEAIVNVKNRSIEKITSYNAERQ